MGLAITDTDRNPPETSDSGGESEASSIKMLDDITDDNERVRAAFTSPDGLTRIGDDEERHVAVSVVMVVTDERILFVAGDLSAGELGAHAGSLMYEDFAAVAIEGQAPMVLALSMANGVRWEFPVPDADPDVVESVLRHLQWIGEVRSRLVACRNDIELAAGEIRDHAEAMNWERAEEVYADHRETLDRLIGAVQWTDPVDDDVIAPELTEMERTLERAYARLAIEHAESQLKLGQQLVENEDYDQARKVLQTAQRHYERASGRADAVERGDAFRFGEQRELRDELDRLEWEIEAVAAEPIRRAHEAKIMGKNADQMADAVDHWETAFRRYGNVLTLDWGDESRNFAGDPDEIRADMREVATDLIDGHAELARKRWNEGVTLERNGEVKDALRACTDAADHLDRAAELATEFRPGAAPAIERRRDGMNASLKEMRDTATVGGGEIDEGENAEEPAEVTDEPTTEPSPERNEDGAADLLDLDTHQEITFDTTVEDGTADGGRRGQRAFDDAETEDERDADGATREGTADSETVLHSEE